MPVTNLIVNGTFNSGSTGWSGVDLETNYRESAYLGNGSNNRVAEMDGRSGMTTVMEQSFAITDPNAPTHTLSIDAALRNASLGQAGSEGFTVEVVNSTGVVVGAMTVLPTSNSFQSFTLDVTFPAPDTYTLRLTELGPDNSLGAIIDNVEMLVCFCKGTLIRTAWDSRPIETLRTGDMLATFSGLKPLRWIGKRVISVDELVADPKLSPVRIKAGALGAGLPHKTLRVSRQHRMLARSPLVERMFGTPEVLVSANKLVGLPGISFDTSVKEISYYHMLFDAHEIVWANDTPSESLLATDRSLMALSPAARAELRRSFPHLMNQHSARMIPPLPKQKRLAERMRKNRRPVIEMDTLPYAA